VNSTATASPAFCVTVISFALTFAETASTVILPTRCSGPLSVTETVMPSPESVFTAVSHAAADSATVHFHSTLEVTPTFCAGLPTASNVRDVEPTVSVGSLSVGLSHATNANAHAAATNETIFFIRFAIKGLKYVTI